jgi:hypothetical protein
MLFFQNSIMAKPHTAEPAVKNTIKKIGKDIVSYAGEGQLSPITRQGDRGDDDFAHALLTVNETAAILRCSVSSLNKWRLTGRGPAFLYVGRRIRYTPNALVAFIKASTRQSTSDPGPEEHPTSVS